ncbi:MAG TPA: hypothetical protein VLA89_17075, partial [Gemmatimonadales bacterium]|nr:hypothetical protein [Gemmatimonadales bacterium]
DPRDLVPRRHPGACGMSAIKRLVFLAYYGLTYEERKELKRLLVKMAVAVAAGTGLLWYGASVIGSQAGAPVPPGIDVVTEVKLPKAPTSPGGVTLCPKGWVSSEGTIPPDAVSQLSPQHIGARSFYTCRKDALEITIFDNGYVSGYEGNNPLTQEQAREALKR